jgi:SAM-dependent methyltransferase
MGQGAGPRQLLAVPPRCLPPARPKARSATVDVGCGEGRLSRDLARLGHRVVGVDASRAMAAAAASHPECPCPAVLADAAALPLADATADCLVAFMSLQDIDVMELALSEGARALSAGSRLIMAITHPLNTAGRFEPGGADDHDRRFVIEGSYLEQRATSDTVERDGYTMTFHSEHRPLQAYTSALAGAGFVIERLHEVTEPDPASKWHRIPLFLHIRALRT